MKHCMRGQRWSLLLVILSTFSLILTDGFETDVEAQSAINWVRLSSKDGTGARWPGKQAETTARAGIGQSFKGPVGLQLYSLRAEFAKDVAGTLAKVRAMGFQYVELAGTYNLTPAELRAELEKAGLSPISMHVPFEALRDKLDSVIADAKTLGVEYIANAWIPHKRPFDVGAARNAVVVFNRAGKRANAAGLKFAYHLHGYEFQPSYAGTLFDLIVTETRPEFVSFELDVFWAFHAGQDPVKLMQRYPKRFSMMHLKDMRRGEKGDLTGNAPDDWSVALGAGQIDFPALLREAKKIGVKWYFIEEESQAPMENIPAGLRYLEKLRF